MNNRQARAQAAALVSEPFVQKHFGFLFEWSFLFAQLAFVIGWLGYEIFDTIPKVEEYNLIISQQKRELLDRIDVKDKSFGQAMDHDAEDFYLRS
jgi:hypothetical protein